jgi:hypothetical protein
VTPSLLDGTRRRPLASSFAVDATASRAARERLRPAIFLLVESEPAAPKQNQPLHRSAHPTLPTALRQEARRVAPYGMFDPDRVRA